MTTGEPTQPGRFTRLKSLRHELLDPLDVVLITAIFVAGFGAAAGLLEVMVDDGRIGMVRDSPLWGKVAFSYAAILLFLIHVRLLRRARDADVIAASEPDSLLGRGLVNKGDYDMLAIIVVGVEGALLANVGELRLSWWALGLVFSFLMRVDLFAAGWMRARPLVRSLFHGLVYAVVFGMLVALAFEAGVNLGLFPIVTHAQGPAGNTITVAFDGLRALDVVTVQPLLLGWLYAGAVAWGMAVELGDEGRAPRAALMLAGLGSLLMTGYAFAALGMGAAAAVLGSAVAAAVHVMVARPVRRHATHALVFLPAMVLGGAGLLMIGWLPG